MYTLFVRTFHFRAEAERSIFYDLRLKPFLIKMFLNLHGIQCFKAERILGQLPLKYFGLCIT